MSTHFDELTDRFIGLVGENADRSWLAKLIDKYRDRLPAFTQEQEAALVSLINHAIGQATEIVDTIGDIESHGETTRRSRKGVATRQIAKDTKRQKILAVYEAANKEGRVATMEELMAAGECGRDTVYRALRPSQQR
jgi:hypothetical protein